MKAHPLFHQFLRVCRADGLTSCELALGVSGGLDSMVLMDLVVSSQKVLRLKPSVIHVHHGSHPDSWQSDFRNQAALFVQEECEFLGLPYQIEVYEGEGPLLSESKCREVRTAFFLKAQERQQKRKPLLLAQHSDDFLETQILRLIRGTGGQGLSPFKTDLRNWYRPLQTFSKSELQSYAQFRGLRWIEDPSNEKEDALRNWVRRSWLPALESRQPGSRAALARSLRLFEESFHSSNSILAGGRIGRSIVRSEFQTLSKNEKKAVLARYFLEQGKKDYTSRHVEEVLKRLGTASLEAQDFPLLGGQFFISKAQFGFREAR